MYDTTDQPHVEKIDDTITIAMPIRRKWKNGDSEGETIDWHATAMRLAERQYDLAIASDSDRRIIASLKKANERLADRISTLEDNLWLIRQQWFFRLFANRQFKQLTAR